MNSQVFPLILIAFIAVSNACLAQNESYDIVVYGGNSAGVIAAVQGALMGKSVLLVEPSKHLGGMTSSGLGWVDIEKPETVGGLTKEFFHRIWLHYQNEEAWNWEPKRTLPEQHGPHNPSHQAMWVLEPHVAEQVFEQMLRETNVQVVRGERLDRQTGVQKHGSRIISIAMESGRTFTGKIYIDASYEGDLLAGAGVSYYLGREDNALYGETINGVQFANLRDFSIAPPLDAYKIKGDPSSGLLPRVFPSPGLPQGIGDKAVQAYNYRMCLTNAPQNVVPIEKPEGYDEQEYEIIFRACEAWMPNYKFFKLSKMPNRKTDSNNAAAISTDYVGMSWNYPEADYATREKLCKAHENWQRGLIWTLQNHPRVPEAVRQFYIPWGLPKDEFTDNNHWPYQLYVREGRRMVSDTVITQNTALGKECFDDAVALGSYHMDSHGVRYYANDEGKIAWDGSFFVKVPLPFPISYRAILPKKTECSNLIVPVCLSSTHAAYGSIRMEPVFMVLGQSAATAASLSIDLDVPLQDLPYEILRARLDADGQVMKYPVHQLMISL